MVAASPRASFALSSASDSTMTRQSFSTSTLQRAHPYSVLYFLPLDLGFHCQSVQEKLQNPLKDMSSSGYSVKKEQHLGFQVVHTISGRSLEPIQIMAQAQHNRTDKIEAMYAHRRRNEKQCSLLKQTIHHMRNLCRVQRRLQGRPLALAPL